ncbi:hypothetical protein JAAARDRAFT_153894 [Jaapia argillacea MUCL 33604]|uniref:SLC41A/MgtE integral membrane domain-containing protein n=1 Tax=Jaapia argillacea MUCL 33604 TaxID=933084 RepID=A0A067QB56_9AGAM|nr:hypothetical protein JAAARDRAFT_153894 [Jaapia argillacea MUCL 33604]
MLPHHEEPPDAIQSTSSLDSSSDDGIELANLEDVAVTPNPRLEVGNGHGFNLPSYSQEDVEDWTEGDEGTRALLGSEERTRGRERPTFKERGVWNHVRSIVIETAPTLLFTTIGSLFTGELLDHISHWKAMTRVDELIMIIPVMLNLQGNLEMNLSARLGTAANIGELDKPTTRNALILGNLSLLQVQATVVSFVAALVAYVIGLIMPNPSPPQGPLSAGNATDTLEALVFHAFTSRARIPHPSRPINDGRPKTGALEYIMVVSTAMSAACLSSIVLGSFMCLLVVMCRRFGRDPDNIAPPIASCLGDVITLSLFGLVSSLLINFINTPFPLILALLIACSAAICTIVTLRNPMVKDLLKEGWSPLLGAMVISSGTGIVLDTFVSRYEGYALLAVVLTGLSGNVGSIFISRLSTALHAFQLLPSPRLEKDRGDPSPRLVMIILLLVTLPVVIITLAILSALGWLHLPFVFIGLSVVSFCCAVSVSLLVARALTNFLWSRDLDPDIYAIPIHSALMDLVGQLLLVLCFEIVSLLGGKVKGNTGYPAGE